MYIYNQLFRPIRIRYLYCFLNLKCMLLIGMLFNSSFSSNIFIVYGSLGYCIPFICAYSSVVMLANIPDEEGDQQNMKNTFTVVYGSRYTVLFASLLCLLSFCFGFYLQEPLSTISSLSALPFFLFALFRGKKKDIIRSIRYPIFLLHFYVFTIYQIYII